MADMPAIATKKVVEQDCEKVFQQDSHTLAAGQSIVITVNGVEIYNKVVPTGKAFTGRTIVDGELTAV